MNAVPPVSSLIFVVILAVWAVYLVQHWVRRRDHVATARSVDRFSEAMRVLERRRALPRPDVADATPRSYSVSPLRPARPEVVVKRGGAQPVATPASATATTRARAGATAVGPTPAQRTARRVAQVRGAALALASIVMVTLVALGVGQVIGLWWSFVGVGVLAATLVLVRRSAAASAAQRRRTARPRRAGAATAASQSAPTAAPVPRPMATRTTDEADDSPLAAQAMAAAAAPRTARRSVDLTATRAPATRPALYDIDAVEASLATAQAGPDTGATSSQSAAQVVPAEAGVVEEGPAPAPGSWSPTPVPPPTYTLKAKAYRGVPTGCTELPADGTEMALDEEFEELPRVDRVV